jgi:hypothetical protein
MLVTTFAGGAAYLTGLALPDEVAALVVDPAGNVRSAGIALDTGTPIAPTLVVSNGSAYTSIAAAVNGSTVGLVATFPSGSAGSMNEYTTDLALGPALDHGQAAGTMIVGHHALLHVASQPYELASSTSIFNGSVDVVTFSLGADMSVGFPVDESTEHDATTVNLVDLGDGLAVIARTAGCYARLVDYGETTASAPVTFGPATCDGPLAAHVVGAGDFAIAYHDTADDRIAVVAGNDTAGLALGPATEIGNATASPRIAETPDGYWTIAGYETSLDAFSLDAAGKLRHAMIVESYDGKGEYDLVSAGADTYVLWLDTDGQARPLYIARLCTT